MPTYDYHCPACGHDFAAMHKISDAAPQCPQCGGAVKKKLSAPAVLGGAGGSAKSAPEISGGGCGSSCGCHRSH